MAITLAMVTTIVGALFVLAVFNQYLSRRKPYQLVWTLGLLLYTAGTFLWLLREAFGTSSAVFRLWYLTGAMLVPAYLGTGTVWLLAPRGFSRSVTIVLALASVVALVLALSVSMRSPLANLADVGALTAKDPVTGVSFFPAYVVVLTILLNTYGTIALVGGALWSVWQAWRQRVAAGGPTARRRAFSNSLVAVGAILPALGGSLEATAIPQPHLWMLLIGLVVLFAGFVASAEVFEWRAFPLRRSGKGGAVPP